MRIIAIDPGGTTGWVVHDLESEKPKLPLKVSGGELGPDLHHHQLEMLLRRWFWKEVPYGLTIVCEAFTYRIVTSKGTKMPGINLISKEYIGVVRRFTQDPIIGNYPCELYEPMPSAAVSKDQKKVFWNNKRLKAYGVYTKGEPHRNDATRHLLTHIINTCKRRDYLWGLRPT